MDDLKERVEKWVQSSEGQKHLKDTAEKIRQMGIEAEQKRRDDIVWWHKIKDKPCTI